MEESVNKILEILNGNNIELNKSILETVNQILEKKSYLKIVK